MTLIERVGRRCRPTVAGAELLAHIGNIDAVVSSALDSVARHAKGAVGRIRLGTGATPCIYLLPPILRELRQRLPKLEIAVSTGNIGDVVKAVDTNEIDIGFVPLPVSGRTLEVIPVLTDDFAFVAPPGTSLPKRINSKTLAQFPIILFEPRGNSRRQADDWLHREGIALKPVMSLGSVEAIKEMVRAGLGCAILPGMSVHSDRPTEQLVVRPLQPKLCRTYAMVIRRDKPLNPGLKEMMRVLRMAGQASRKI